jgi:glycosyltransferase involved in cell wall biosynthesis
MQTNPNWRCIVIYDGVDGGEFEDNRIETFRVEKTGIIGKINGQSGLVRNFGIEKAKSPWIGFLDDDDTLNPNYVDVLFKKYLNYDFVIWRMVYPDGKIIPKINDDGLRFGNVGISFCYKNIHNNLLFENNRIGEDIDMIMKLKQLTSNWVITPEIYYNVRH